jgi:aryl-alcohol dehydrogenase-like predicted oxidoreductase
VRYVAAVRPWTRRLGADGPTVTGLGLGLAALGRPGYLNLGHGADLGADRSVAALRAHTHEVLDAARAAGIGYLDAARSYGRAEEFLGSWLRERGVEPGEVTVGSKWGYTYTADWAVDADPPEVKDLSAATFDRQVEETRAHLGDHLTLYQIHSATVESGVLDDSEVRARLRALRETGVRVGFTATGPEQAATIDRAVQVGGFDAVQATWNLLEPSAGAALDRAHDAGLGVIVKEAVANGRLAGETAPGWLRELAAGHDTTTGAVALAAALARPWADVVLSGAATVRQLEENLRARDVAWTEEDEERVRHAAEDPAAYWERRSALEWT